MVESAVIFSTSEPSLVPMFILFRSVSLSSMMSASLKWPNASCVKSPVISGFRSAVYFPPFTGVASRSWRTIPAFLRNTSSRS